MGNRAVITTKKAGVNPANSDAMGVYLHWNGGRDSVEAFLAYCKLKQFRSPEKDNYGWARLCQVIGNFFGGGLSIGIGPCCTLDCDNLDNGTYIIEDWEIVGRAYFDGREQNEYNLNEMLMDIDEAQPVHSQLGKDFFKANEINTTSLEVGDVVYVYDQVRETHIKHKVVGFKDGVPFIDKFGDEKMGYSWNASNYINTDTVRLVERWENVPAF